MGKLLLSFRLALNLIVNKTFNMNLFNLHYLFQTFLTIPYIATLKLPTPKRQKKTLYAIAFYMKYLQQLDSLSFFLLKFCFLFLIRGYFRSSTWSLGPYR